MASDPKRQTVVFTALLTVLGGTSLFLLAIRPAPLPAAGAQEQPGQSQGLMAPGLMAQVPTTPVDPVVTPPAVKPAPAIKRVAQWTNVFIRSTHGGSAEMAAGDHFVILPGLGSGEGRLLVNPAWKNQTAAPAIKGVNLPEGCVTIVMVGDFDRTPPTPGQMQTLRKLLTLLRAKFGLSATPLVVTQPNNPTAIGRNFPQIWPESSASK